ncbi:MAG: Putative DNA-binding protein [uncultured Arthrobacter sp.]|uniref:DNA-binding protein n=2 Tax=uncultured Arthrobacter sp. TaxID=114050 RepID=A0A6J4I9N8_9MICC|nr:MAG: Putative DNA-binding protein [uncultured Arthrobacter sp.]
MGDMTADRSQLGAFLRSRRDQLTPGQAGMQAFPGPRRVPGLRKEELAVLAGVSPDYYGRLEQGRQANISRSVLEALARALRLTDTERDHLFDLAGPPDRPGRSPASVQQADPGLLRLMGSLDHLPALILGQRSDVLATNRLFTIVVRDLEPFSSFGRFLFLDPLARQRIINWEHFAAASIAALRRESGRRPHDTRLKALIDELRSKDEDAARWWDDHTVQDYASVAKQIRHPLAGELSFDLEMVTPPLDPDQRLIVYTVQPGSETAQKIPFLASWNAQDTVKPLT